MTVTLQLETGDNEEFPLEMMGATTGLYAAKRAAEAMGAHPDIYHWELMDKDTGQLLKDHELVADWDGKTVLLVARDWDDSEVAP